MFAQAKDASAEVDAAAGMLEAAGAALDKPGGLVVTAGKWLIYLSGI